MKDLQQRAVMVVMCVNAYISNASPGLLKAGVGNTIATLPCFKRDIDSFRCLASRNELSKGCSSQRLGLGDKALWQG